MLPTDIYVLCPDGRKVHSHLSVLRAASSKLRDVLQGFHGDHLPVQGVDSSALEQIIHSFYSGICSVSCHTIPAIYDAARMLMVSSLTEECQNFVDRVEMNADSCCTLLEGCLLHRNQALSRACYDYALNNYEAVTSSASFLTSSWELVSELLYTALDKKLEPLLIMVSAAAWLQHDSSRSEYELRLEQALNLPRDSVAELRKAYSQGFPSRPAIIEQEVILKVDSWVHLIDPIAAMSRMEAEGSAAQEEFTSSLLQASNTHGSAENSFALQASLLALIGAGGVAPGAGVLQQLQMEVVTAAAASEPGVGVDGVKEEVHDSMQLHGKRKREEKGPEVEDVQHVGANLQQQQQQEVVISGSNMSQADIIAALTSGSNSSEGQANLLALLLQQQPTDGGNLLMQMSGGAGSANNTDALKQLLSLSMDQQQQAAAHFSATAASLSSTAGGSGVTDEAQALHQLLAAGGLGAMSGLSAGSYNSSSLLMSSLNGLQQDPSQLAALSALTMGVGSQDSLSMNITNLFSGGAHQLLGLHGSGNQGLMQHYGLLQQSSGGLGQYGDEDRRGKGGRQPRLTPLGAKGLCHVENCNVDITGLREYHLRYKICEYHLKAPSVLKDGQNQRFCQQCGRFHTLDAFDGNRRSCRNMLQRHNARRAKKSPADTPTGVTGCAWNLLAYQCIGQVHLRRM
ncbi:hypothetical protein CEUSTIGMA_g3589.t1 [Chlamydomonas eustigma]|uniref:SBP-type domain-containing protein n=1 Tax=Chlamydomonas eustigma TaxID=1157962 RepID=A0A250WZD6_9CHLO|nr:hypothetical protein CEUSTIGMA_g3589.t1 [Chlamydomonas eustigma]|eukprot:GAX76145.1 hypothetical protein CEUSTIGMA_g3589.t1 [Chlamydomonas eustigma]